MTTSINSSRSTRSMLSMLSTAVAIVFTLTACSGSGSDSGDGSTPDAPTEQPASTSGIRVVAAVDASDTIANAPDDLVILDVRTQEEFDEGHVDGAVMLDFYRDDFAAELAKLDPTVPYVLYCRSGNRSAQTRTIMSDLGFQTVDDVEGGIISWQQAGLPIVTE